MILKIQFVAHTILIVVERLCSPTLSVLMRLEAVKYGDEEEVVSGFQLGHD